VNPPDIPVAAVGCNVVLFRRDEGPVMTHAYVSPGFGAGVDKTALRPQILIAQAMQFILKRIGILPKTEMFRSTTAITPFNFGDLGGAVCRITQLRGGILDDSNKGVQILVSGHVWFRDRDGKCMFAIRKLLSADLSGSDCVLGAKGSFVGGPLYHVARVDKFLK
jgi:hypothetical protein